jgi:hypothetical protein
MVVRSKNVAVKAIRNSKKPTIVTLRRQNKPITWISHTQQDETILILGVCILLRVRDQGKGVFRVRNINMVGF